MRQHLLGIQTLSKEQLLEYLVNANSFVEVSQRSIKKVPSLRGKTIINLFMEPSTRTRASFEIAAKRLSSDAINVSSSGSSTSKGETLLDTAINLQSMAPDVLVVRHAASGAAHFLAKQLKNTNVVNAGDGTHEHPTQALLDCLTLKRHFEAQGRSIEGLKVAFVGDIVHSRVIRSNLYAHALLGSDVTLIAPPTLLPPEFAHLSSGHADGHVDGKSNVTITHSLEEGLKGADVVYCLRMQNERQGAHFIPSINEYSRQFCVTEKVLAKVCPKAVVLHPGPINRGVELASEVADGPRSLITEQVSNGVAVRMAVLFSLATGKKDIDVEERG